MIRKGILFVDDESNVIDGLKRMLYSKKKEWNLFYALSGEEALGILDKETIHVIISDMRMPHMNGAELLSIVQKEYPQVIRLILSGHSDEELSLQSTSTAHQFITKPCDSKYLIEQITKSLEIKDFVFDSNIQNIVTGIDALPSLPELYLKLEEEMNKKDPSMKFIGEIISKDIAMSAKILQLVNSAFFGLPTQISSPTQAVNLLGVNIIKALTLYIQVFSSYDNPKCQSFIKLVWEHSLKVAELTKKIISKRTNKKQSIDDSFIAGLLHDMGKLILIDYKDYADFVVNNDEYSLNEEYSRYGASHAEIGAYLTVLWNLPNQISEAIAYHHKSPYENEFVSEIAGAVYIANSSINNQEIEPELLKKYFNIENIDMLNKLEL